LFIPRSFLEDPFYFFGMSFAQTLLAARASGTLLSMVTCYDAAYAELCREARIDLLLVGDSLANVVLGFERTAQVGMAEMLHHTAAVRRGAKDALVVADLPYGSDGTVEDAVRNGLALQAAGADAVKLEGGKFAQVRALVEAGVPVVGHLGLLPQTATSLKQAGRDPVEAQRILDDALGLEQAGAASVVLEHIPSDLAERITAALRMPTIGIGAGAKCSGQVLVLHDMLGLSARRPPFAKAFGKLREATLEALSAYVRAVRGGEFPG
jgi:3-methyl-2-oxobutanoate hydroxymethyltransferase